MGDVTTRSDPTPGRSWMQILGGCGTAADVRNQLRFVAWVFAWALLYVAATWLLKQGSVQGALAWLVVAVPTVVGAIAVAQYLRFLREADELTRRIQLEGVAIGFAVGVLFGVGYQLAERAGAPKLDIGDFVPVMLVAWSIGQLAAQQRYR